MVIEKLSKIQSKLKVPKDKGGNGIRYKYRSCEDITEMVKPLLAEYGATLVMSDELVLIGDRFYIKATVKIMDADSVVEAVGYAREEESSKMMSQPQLTGSASSYARKYALCGLFCLDDSKDADQVADIQAQYGEKAKQFCMTHGLNQNAFFQYYRVNSFADMTADRIEHMHQNANDVIAFCQNAR